MWKVYGFIVLTISWLVLAFISMKNGEYWRFAVELFGGVVSAFMAIEKKRALKK